MTILPGGRDVRPTDKVVFKTALEARLALSLDPKLGTVYLRAREVFVVTASGSGTFTRREWEQPQGTGGEQ